MQNRDNIGIRYPENRSLSLCYVNNLGSEEYKSKAV